MDVVWQSGEPDISGYYLVAWRSSLTEVIVSELWYNPDSSPKWWWSRGYTGERRSNPMDNAFKREVLAWTYMPEFQYALKG